MTVITLLFIYIIFILMDLLPLYKEQKWASFWIYFVLLVANLVLALLIDLNVEIPSPAGPIKELISFIWRIE